MGRAELLARCSDEPGRLTRLYGTPAHASATSTVSGWMRAAGMTVHRDAIGNLIGRFEGDDPDAPAVLLGSHLDTVRDAGRWDGTLGVLVAGRPSPPGPSRSPCRAAPAMTRRSWPPSHLWRCCSSDARAV
jgi:acetylornithine deacetylase/succinyl-diaminopimelate desuccinylase-like protein